MIAVYQRCLANYQSRQWDMGTHALFDPSLHGSVQTQLPTPDCFPLPPELGYPCLSDCLLAAQRDGVSNEACLQHWLMVADVNSLDHFEYEAAEGTTLPHACQVFSGPAKLSGAVGAPFRTCMDEYEDAGLCKLPSIVWSGRSTNKVPVALDHSTIIQDANQKLQAARNTYAAIQRDVREALDAMGSWNASKLNVMVFSAEGDMLHQFFDCFMMGAAGNAEVWPGPDAPKPIWSRRRDGSDDRGFELPCSGEALRDRLGKRDSRSPFTCGSYARRSAMKYFLRNEVQNDPTMNQNIIQNATAKLVESLRQAWLVDNLDLYLCQCSDGRNSPECCVLDPSCDPASTKCPCTDGSEPSYACCDTQCTDSTFLPPRFQVEFTKLKGQDLLADLFGQAATFLSRTVMLDNRPWLTYDMGGAEAYNWTKDQLQVPLEQAMFDTTAPVQRYDHSELGYPFRTTIWDMCHGLLQQIHFTLPMKDGRPTTVTQPLDPDAQSTTLNMTYREDFVRKLVQDAYKQSPLFWHYVARHQPTQSAMCARASPSRPTTVNDTFFVQGYNALKVGGYLVDCYCGWWFNASHCQIPGVVCDRLVLIVGSEAVQRTCRDGGVSAHTEIDAWMGQLIDLEGGWRDWPCPSMSVSDHWGIVRDQTAWLKGSVDVSGTSDLILRNGTSGLRVGSLQWLLSNAVRHINPSIRRESVQPLTCELQPPQTMVDNFVDELFPAAQGVRQSAAVSACLRFTIELARLSAYQEASLVVAAAEQSSVVALWRQRCEMKLKQVAFCHVYGVYDIPKVSTSCPFLVSGAFDGYTLTPSCLIVYGGKVYDPCLCNAKWCSQTMDKLNLLDLTDACSVLHVRSMAVDTSTGVPPWPTESDTPVPRTLARSSFMEKVLVEPGNVANNFGHWSSAEGAAFRYCDVVVDWWPDDWKHPVGYHVTLPCTDAAHRAFDASWAALRVGAVVKMMHVPNALRNRTLQTNVFGAASACRTHNYGMPMRVINSMRFCTQADNRAVDPSVPASYAMAADWGVEYCTTSPYDVPWSNGPSSVGTFFDYLVDMLPFTSWGDSAGHAPFKACASDVDCCATCKCLLSKVGGICAVVQNGTFECAQHHHCTQKMCAGDGRCVEPVLEVRNDASFDIVGRVFADKCEHAGLDTWGTSKEDVVPDILESSGMCSYRSWFEQRGLKNCSSTQCLVSATEPWMYSSPRQAPRAAFEAGVLKIKAHACDRSYEHLDGLVSCNPTATLLRDSSGATQPFTQGFLTQTYRPTGMLPVVKHDWTNQGLGFLGMPKNYSELGYGSMSALPTGSLLRPCSNFGLCAVQSSARLWYVNGNNEPVRLVTVRSGSSYIQRPYNIDDQMACGSMGFVDGLYCRIDAAVAPLFYLTCTAASSSPICSTYAAGLYRKANTVAQLKVIADDLNNLFDTMRDASIDQWSQYLLAVDKAMQLWTDMQSQAWLSAFPSARVDQRYNGVVPKGLYYLLTYSAYELPFAWWWRCSWLSGLRVSQNPQSCEAWDDVAWTKGSYEERLQIESTVMRDTTKKAWLARANGIFRRVDLDKARNSAHQKFIDLVNNILAPKIDFTCYEEASFLKNVTDFAYDQMVSTVVSRGDPWPTSRNFGFCNGVEQCLDHKRLTVDATKDLIADIKRNFLTGTPCNAQCKCTTNLATPLCSFGQDHLPLAGSLSGQSMARDRTTFTALDFVPGTGTPLSSTYDVRTDGCSLVHCCEGQPGCSGTKKIAKSECSCFHERPSEMEITYSGVTPEPDVPPWLVFSDTKGQAVTGTSYLATSDSYVAIDLCKPSGLDTRCTFGDTVRQDDCSTLTNNVAQAVRDTYCHKTKALWGQDSAEEICAYKKRDMSSVCLGGHRISDRYVTKPSQLNLDLTLIVAPPKDCWFLKCPLDGPYRNYDNTITYNPSGFAGEYYVEVRTTQVGLEYDVTSATLYWWLDATRYTGCANPAGGCWKYDSVFRNVRTTLVEVFIGFTGSTPIKVMSYNTRFCDKASTGNGDSCKQNTKGTRSNSKEIVMSNLMGYQWHDTTTYPELSTQNVITMVQTVLNETEDFFDEARYSPLCLSVDISIENLKRCINDKYAIESSNTCSAADNTAVWLKYVEYLCTVQQEAKWYRELFCPDRWRHSPYIACQNDATDNRDRTPAKAKCIAHYTDNTYMRDNHKFLCSKTVYRGSFGSSCDRTPQQCPFHEKAQTIMSEAGLPTAGFCPDCVLSAGCAGSKSANTYRMMKNNIKINDLSPAKLRSANDRTPPDTAHFYARLNAINSDIEAPQCNIQTCASDKHLVELYKGMFVCIPCSVVPPKHCTGKHMCSFQPWDWADAPLRKEHLPVFTRNDSSFSAVYDAVRANLLATISKSMSLAPVWHDFLEPFNFTRYNPLELKLSFNDNMESLGGYCASDNNLPEFTKCQNDAPRRTIKSFAASKYKILDGSLVPAGHTLLWHTSRAQMMSTNIVSWHMAQRQAFFNELFNDTMCKSGNIANLICFKDMTTSTPTTLTVNPVLSGRFEIQEGCDVVEEDSDRIIDSVCNLQTCFPPAGSSSMYDKYNTFVGTDYAAQSAQMRCKMRNGATASFLSTPKWHPTNLCSKKPSSGSICELKQGIVGQKTWDGSAVDSVYSRLTWPTSVMPSGLLSGKNPVLNKISAAANTLGNITLDPWDIAGHYVRMTLGESLSVTGLPLTSYRSLSDAAQLSSSVDWLGNWRRAMVSEGRTMDQYYVLSTCRSWDCPLRRRFFWSGADSNFRPCVPNPFRTQLLYGTLTHPTTKPSLLPSGALLQYQTRNGFCLCPRGESCQPSSGSCSTSDTILSLSDMQYRSARVLQTPCPHQVDWPWTGASLRDDTFLPPKVVSCGVLDRLPPFQYRYHNSRTVLDNERTTLDEGGDCHMGRPASYDATTQACTLVEKTQSHMVVHCDGYNVTLPRPKSADVNLVKRTRCDQCDPLPTFHAADGTALNESEVSYGKLWRWAPSRKLAQDLRFRLCGNATECPQLDQTKLDKTQFWSHLMAGGLTGTPTNTVNQLFSNVPEDPDEWAATPWMLCTTKNGETECEGAASKRAWLADRAGTCSSIKDLPNAGDAVADLTLCDLDESLDNLCRVIQNARYRLFEANCRLSGKCRTSSFFYQPATYSITNDQLSRQTVQYFYDFAVAGSCPAMSVELEQILAQNQKTAQECSAQSLEMFQLAISAARKVLHFFVKIIYYFAEIGMNIISLVLTVDPNPIIRQIMTNLEMLLNEFRQFFVVMGDTMYKMIMETGQLGKFIRDLVMAICEFLKWIVDNLIKPVVCFIKEFVIGVLYVLEIFTRMYTLNLAGSAYDTFEDWRVDVRDKFDCDFDNPFVCSKIFPEAQTGPTRLPMPTRCWVGYKPTVGEQKGLGCSASDTCMDDDGSFIACASCSRGTDMDRYGCDALTKLCRCHTFPVGQSQCSSHQECFLPDVECGFVDAYLQPSFGNVPCVRCSQTPVCLVTGSVGQCTCTLRATSVQTCSAHAQRVTPDPTQLCLVSLGIAASSSSSYSANYRDLASTACANLNGAQSWCLNVWLDQGGSAYLTVGLALLRGRRLLTLPSMSNVTNWDKAQEPCRSLLMAQTLTTLEAHVASDCERWRQIGERSILLFNLTNVTDVQFTSYTGMAEADIPIHVYISLVQYTEWVQPVLALARRYMHTLSPLLNITVALFQDYVSEMRPLGSNVEMVRDLLPWFAVSNETRPEPETGNHSAGRRLLHWKDDLSAVRRFSIAIANGNAANLAPDLAAEWNRGPFVWPPRYRYTEEEHKCLAGSLALNMSLSALKSTFKYYARTGPQRPPVDRSFRGSLPALGQWTGSPAAHEPPFVSSFKSMARTLLGIDFSSLKSYTSSPDYGVTPSPFSEDLTDFIRCDFDKVQHCSAHRRSLFWGGVVVAILFAMLSYLFRLLSVPMVDPLLFLAYVPAVMFYVFGVSAMCFPMLPTCFMGEVVDLVQTVFPVSFQWPAKLQHWDGCVDGTPRPPDAVYVLPGSAQCFRECTEWPFEYQTWEDNVAWVQCDLGFCDASFVRDYYQPLAATLPLPNPFYDFLQMKRYVDAVEKKSIYLKMPDDRQAQQVCCLFTIFNVVPVLLAVVAVAILVLAAAALAVAVAQGLCSMVLALLAFIHCW